MYFIKSDSVELIKSIRFLLGNEKCIVEENEKKIIIRGNIQQLDIFLKEKKFLSYNNCLNMLFDLEKQNRLLLKHSLCIFCIRTEDILIVDGEKFVFVNSCHLKKVDSNGKITFFSPFSRLGFFSPELSSISILPSTVSWKTFYYSLGLLIMSCVSEKKNLIESLKHVEKTKLYWAILRLTALDCEKRCFLYI